MQNWLLFIGTLIAFFGLAILAGPNSFLKRLRRYNESIYLHLAAVLARVIVGVLLVMVAEASRMPMVLTILGWFSIAVAVVLTCIGRTRFKKLMVWTIDLCFVYGRAIGLLPLVLGIFIVYVLT